MSDLVKLSYDDQQILEQAADLLCQLSGKQFRLDGTPFESDECHQIHRTERSIMRVIETHGEVK